MKIWYHSGGLSCSAVSGQPSTKKVCRKPAISQLRGEDFLEALIAAGAEL
jgi:hypothetical protein